MMCFFWGRLCRAWWPQLNVAARGNWVAESMDPSERLADYFAMCGLPDQPELTPDALEVLAERDNDIADVVAGVYCLRRRRRALRGAWRRWSMARHAHAHATFGTALALSRVFCCITTVH